MATVICWPFREATINRREHRPNSIACSILMSRWCWVTTICPKLFGRVNLLELPCDSLFSTIRLRMGMWLKNDPKIRGLAEDVLRDPRSCQRGFVRKDFIQHLFQSMDQDNTTFYGDVLYSFLMLELWYRKHMDGQPA